MSRWRLVIVCIVFYLTACLLASAIITVRGDSALPVSVRLTGALVKDVVSVDVYRVSINGGQKLLPKKEYIARNTVEVKEVTPTIYFQAIQVKLSDKELNNLTSIVVKIGAKEFTFSRKELIDSWLVINNSYNQRIYQSPISVSAPRFALPFWKKVINLGLSWHLLTEVFINKLPLLILIITFLVLQFSTGRNFVNTIATKIKQQGSWTLYVSGLLAVVIAFFRMPFYLQPIGAGLDPSWGIGLNWAMNKGLLWGTDLVFTYGPYYWLLFPNLMLDKPMLLLSLAMTMLVYIYSIGVFIYYIIVGARQQSKTIPVAILALLTLSFFEYTLMDIAIVAAILVFAMDGKRSYFKQVLPVCLLLALLSLCKFSYLAVSLCVLVFVSLQLLVRRDYGNSLLLILTFIGAFYGLWLLSGQPVSNLALFIKYGYEIAQGYPEAMATPIWNEAVSIQSNIATIVLLIGIGVILLFGIVIVFFSSLKKDSVWFELLLTSPVLFLAFKEGYIRTDPGHAALFFSQLQVVLIAYLIFYQRYRAIPTHVSTILTSIFIILLLVTDAHIPIGYSAETRSIFNSYERAEILTSGKKNLQEMYPLDSSFRSAIKKTTVDIIPYDISLLYGYGLNWSPRPIFQSYSAYTTMLDSLNASYLKKSPPDQLIFSFKSIDNRYPLFDEPSLVKEMIKSYQVTEVSSNTYLLLHQKAKPELTLPPIKSSPVTESYLNTNIPIPKQHGYHTYFHAQMELTLLGKALNFLLKIQPPSIEINTGSNRPPQRFRLIRNTAKDGLLVSTFAENFRMVSDLFSGSPKPNVTSVKLIGNTWLYHSTVKTSFQFEPYL